MTTILGLNAYYGDASACLVIDGKLVAAAEEERFRRVKHWAGFPVKAVRYCLAEGKLELKDIEHIAINSNPKANLLIVAATDLSARSFYLADDRRWSAGLARSKAAWGGCTVRGGCCYLDSVYPRILEIYSSWARAQLSSCPCFRVARGRRYCGSGWGREWPGIPEG